MLTLLAGTGKYKDDNSNEIGEHLNELLCASRKAGNEYARDIKSTENVGRENCALGSPKSKDYDRDSKPTTVTKAIVCPCSGCVIHYKIP